MAVMVVRRPVSFDQAWEWNSSTVCARSTREGAHVERERGRVQKDSVQRDAQFIKGGGVYSLRRQLEVAYDGSCVRAGSIRCVASGAPALTLEYVGTVHPQLVFAAGHWSQLEEREARLDERGCVSERESGAEARTHR